jgi:hypothetical protein
MCEMKKNKGIDKGAYRRRQILSVSWLILWHFKKLSFPFPLSVLLHWVVAIASSTSEPQDTRKAGNSGLLFPRTISSDRCCWMIRVHKRCNKLTIFLMKELHNRQICDRSPDSYLILSMAMSETVYSDECDKGRESRGCPPVVVRHEPMAVGKSDWKIQ